MNVSAVFIRRPVATILLTLLLMIPTQLLLHLKYRKVRPMALTIFSLGAPIGAWLGGFVIDHGR